MGEFTNFIKNINTTIPDPAYVVSYKNCDNRIITIDTEIDEFISETCKMILIWNMEDKGIPVEERKPIKIRIFSYGGDLDWCYTLIGIIELSKTPVYTYNIGNAMSAALLILLSGHKRYCVKRSMALIHSGFAKISGTAEQVEEFQKSYKKQLERAKDFILEKTNIDKKLYNKKQKTDWYLEDNEQLSLGIVDYIVDDIDEMY